jgi:PAS domain S-box-containing protein
LKEFSDRYSALLSRYLNGEGDAARAGGLELAHEAISHKNPFFELAQASVQGTDRALAAVRPELHGQTVAKCGEFLVGCIEAFEAALEEGRDPGEEERANAEQAQAARKTVDQALQVTERNYQRLFEGHPEPMWIFDLETLAFLAVNAAALRHYGYSRAEFLAMKIADIRPPEQLPAALDAVARNEDLQRAPGWVHRTKSGTLMDVEITSYRVVFGDRPARFVMAQDVTEKKRLEQQIRQSQRLESLGQLAGGVAHDFNNLLSVILNYAAFVKERLASVTIGGDDARLISAMKDVERIERAGQSAAHLTHQLLAFARREAVQPKSLDVNSVVSELEPLLRRTLGEHIEVETRPEPELWPVFFDPGQLEQVLMNLVVNARDAMSKGGRLTIETANVEVDDAYASGRPGLRPGRFVQLRITDTGSGMDKPTLDRAFEPFFTTKPKGQGTGLGLATIYGVVHQAGGYVGIYSEVGVGTRVTTLLPATNESPAQPVETRIDKSNRGVETVLVVEDAEDLREVVARILSRNGYAVILASDGIDALEVARRHAGEIHLLLSDVVMPKMQGPELSTRLSAARPQIRVLFMSGYPQPLLGPSGELPPEVVLIEKPFNEATLLAGVRHVLDS